MKAVRLVESSDALPQLIKKAETQELSYSQFLLSVMTYEQQRRSEKVIEKRLKWASFPIYKTLEEFSLSRTTYFKKQSFNQLTDLAWLDQLYNLILAPLAGKTHLAIGIGIKAIQEGYKVAFISMGELIQVLKTEEMTRKSRLRLKRIREANLVILDYLNVYGDR